jgi:hypothetical protein
MSDEGKVERIREVVQELEEATRELAEAIRALWACPTCREWTRFPLCPHCGAAPDFEAWVRGRGEAIPG